MSAWARQPKACLQAAFGDMLIMLLAYGAVAVAARSRRWIVAARGWPLAAFVATGLQITAGIEWLATRGHCLETWNYLPAMPLVPGTGIGVAPLLQWVLLPLLTAWFVGRALSQVQDRPAA